MVNMKKFIITLVLVLLFTNDVWAVSQVTCEQALKAEKPFILYLHSDTCGACKMFTPVFYQVMDSISGYNLVDINYSYPQASNVCSNAQSKTIPAVYVVDPQKRTRSKINYETYFEQEELKKSLLNLLKQ